MVAFGSRLLLISSIVFLVRNVIHDPLMWHYMVEKFSYFSLVYQLFDDERIMVKKITSILFLSLPIKKSILFLS